VAVLSCSIAQFGEQSLRQKAATEGISSVHCLISLAAPDWQTDRLTLWLTVSQSSRQAGRQSVPMESSINAIKPNMFHLQWGTGFDLGSISSFSFSTASFGCTSLILQWPGTHKIVRETASSVLYAQLLCGFWPIIDLYTCQLPSRAAAAPECVSSWRYHIHIDLYLFIYVLIFTNPMLTRRKYSPFFPSSSVVCRIVSFDIFNAPIAIIRWSNKAQSTNKGNRNNQYKFYNLTPTHTHIHTNTHT